jgi:hypothetical protein
MIELASVAVALARADRERALTLAGEAEQLAGRLSDDEFREQAETLRSVALALAGAGEFEWAERTALRIAEPGYSRRSYRDEALDAVMEALADAGAWDQARRVAPRPCRPARPDPRPGHAGHGPEPGRPADSAGPGRRGRAAR